MSGPPRNPDRLNTMGVVVIGICSAVLVYVTIVALEAFYVNDTSEVQTMADYGGQDITAKGHKADEMRNITEAASNSPAPGAPQTYRIPIDQAMKLVVETAKTDPSHLIPALPKSDKATIQPIFGRPKLIVTAPPAAAAGTDAGSGAAAGSGSGAPAAAATGTTAAPMNSTGSPGALDRVPGSGGKAMPNPPTPRPTAPGAHAP